MAGESAADLARRQREKAARLLSSAEKYEKGALGEMATATTLRGLSSASWTVMHDVRWPGRPRANIDHVVVGPAGVFVIDSKNWSGRIAVRDDVLRQNGYSRAQTVDNAAEAALAVATLIPLHDVQPVICFTGDEVDLDTSARGVLVTSTSNLLDVLTGRPPVLTSAGAKELAFELDAQLRSAASAAELSRMPAIRQREMASATRMPSPTYSPIAVRVGLAIVVLASLVSLPSVVGLIAH